MLVFDRDAIRDWDAYTIAQEPIASIGLMERAAAACVHWITDRGFPDGTFRIFCGKGNNGGDGLAIARLLFQQRCRVKVYVLDTDRTGTPDFETNLRHLPELPLYFIQGEEQIPFPAPNDLVIDALYGSGLNKPLEGLAAAVAERINTTGALVLAVDLPSGLFPDRPSLGNTIVRAAHTLTFQCYKPALLLQENAPFIGAVEVLDIGLHPGFLDMAKPVATMIDAETTAPLYRPRPRFAHKGAFGHALLLAGSRGKMGAALLAAGACLRSGAGLLSVQVPGCGYTVLQTALPEAMAFTDPDPGKLTELQTDPGNYTAVGLGPGLGTDPGTAALVKAVLGAVKKPVVVDADGLNILGIYPELLSRLPAGSLLTPHPKEFERLFGAQDSDFQRVETARRKAMELGCVLVVKSHHTLVATPGGQLYFNSTGNAGMAKGGSGDVLTGMLTGLLAQGYNPVHAALLGVYLHGLAGDIAGASMAQESMLASDLIKSIAPAFARFGGN